MLVALGKLEKRVAVGHGERIRMGILVHSNGGCTQKKYFPKIVSDHSTGSCTGENGIADFRKSVIVFSSLADGARIVDQEYGILPVDGQGVS